MNWPAHFAIGFLLALAASYLLGSSNYEIIVLSIFAGSSALLPDLDHGGSKAKELLDKVIILVAFVFTFLLYCRDLSCIMSEAFLLRTLAFAGAYFLVFTYLKPEHRGITHSLVAAALFALLVFFVLGKGFAFAGLIGYLSHLLADREIKII